MENQDIQPADGELAASPTDAVELDLNEAIPFREFQEKLETNPVFRGLMGMQKNHFPMTWRISSEEQYTRSFAESQAANRAAFEWLA